MRSPVLLLALWGILSAAAVQAGSLSEDSHRDKLYDIASWKDNLIAVGYPGLMIRSSDRGATFELLDSGTTDALFAVDMIGNGKGIIVGRSGLVLTTEDGGRTWTRRVTSVKGHLFGVELTESGKAWAVGHFGTLIHSTDAGHSWKPQSFDASLPQVEGGHAGISSAEAENEGAVEEARLNAVSFANDQVGWIVGEFGLILHTTDGGQTWKRQLGASGKLLFAVQAVDQQHVLVSGSEGTFMETRDAGQTWKAHPTGVTQHLLGLCPIGNSLYLVGRDGVVLRRSGEDQAFKRLPSGLFTWLNAVLILDAKVGFAVGGRGHLLKTSDSGESWQRITGR